MFPISCQANDSSGVDKVKTESSYIKFSTVAEVIASANNAEIPILNVVNCKVTNFSIQLTPSGNSADSVEVSVTVASRKRYSLKNRKTFIFGNKNPKRFSQNLVVKLKNIIEVSKNIIYNTKK